MSRVGPGQVFIDHREAKTQTYDHLLGRCIHGLQHVELDPGPSNKEPWCQAHSSP